MTPGTERPRRLERFEVVRCLQCGSTYDKPVGVGLRDSNPGCPACDYVGWIKASPVTGASAAEPRRFGAGPRPRPVG